MGLLCTLGSIFSLKAVCTTLIASLVTIYFARKRAQGIETNKNIIEAEVSTITKILNFLLWPLFWYELRREFRPLKLNDLKFEAIEKAGVGADFANFDNDSFQIVIDLINENRKLMTPLGFFLCRSYLSAILEKRLKFFSYIKDEKVEKFMSENQIRAPTFVVGLPRSGTTFLHRLLSLDPNVRAPKMYELKDPIELIPDDVEKDATERIKRLKKSLKIVEMVIPRKEVMHETGADLPEECHHASIDKPRSVFTHHLLVGCKKEIKLDEDFYKTYYKQLQVLSHNAFKAGDIEQSQKRWVLKCPAHLRGGMDTLVKVFPDAKIVWTHRDLNNCMSSQGSMFKIGQDVTKTVCEINKLGKEVVEYTEASLVRGDTFVSKTTNPCCNIKYSDMVKDPVNTIREIYKELGNEFTDEYEKILEDYVSQNKVEREKLKKKKGGEKLHSHSLAASGITNADVEKFSWYTEKYIS